MKRAGRAQCADESFPSAGEGTGAFPLPWRAEWYRNVRAICILLLSISALIPTSVAGGTGPLPSLAQLTIDSTTVLPNTNDFQGPYGISSHIVSPHGLAEAYLYHRIDGEMPYTVTPMSPLGGDLYFVNLDGPGRGGGVIDYFIHAIDSAFSVKRDPENAPLDTYRFQVYYVPDFLSPDSVTGLESFHPGAGFHHQWEDFDEDGDLDLLVVPPSQSEPNRLYRYDGSRTFTDVSDLSGAALPGWLCRGVASGDFDNDGYADLAVVAALSHPFLLHNRGDGTFEDVSSQAGFREGLLSPRDLFWTDADADGFLDLIVVAEDGVFLYMSEGGMSFENEAAVRGLPYGDHDFLGAVSFDADGDGEGDILFAGERSRFFLNESGSYVDMTAASGLGIGAASGIPIDVDQDGDLDFLLNGETAMLFRNRGDAVFTDESAAYGVDSIAGSTPAAGDINMDGSPDIGFGEGDLYLKGTEPQFLDVSPFSGITRPFSLIDVDGDGFVDIYAWLNRLWFGAGFPGEIQNSWIEVRLTGQVSNRSAIGAVAVLFTGNRAVTGIVPGKSPLPRRLFFGLESGEPDSLAVRWPTGAVQVERDVPENALVEIVEDSTASAIAEGDPAVRAPVSFDLRQNYPNPFNPSTTISFTLSGTPGERQHVLLSIFRLRGSRVRILIDAELEPGQHDAVWDGRDEDGQPVASGIYFSTLKTDHGTATRKMTLVR